MKEIKVLYTGENVIGALDLTHGKTYRGIQDKQGMLFVQDDFSEEYHEGEKLKVHENCYCVPYEKDEYFKIVG